MGRPDAARREQIGVAVAQRVDRVGDIVLVIGDDPHLLQVDADRRHDVGKMADVAVLGAAGKDLVANDEHRCGNGVGHGRPLHSRPEIARQGWARQ